MALCNIISHYVVLYRIILYRYDIKDRLDYTGLGKEWCVVTEVRKLENLMKSETFLTNLISISFPRNILHLQAVHPVREDSMYLDRTVRVSGTHVSF